MAFSSAYRGPNPAKDDTLIARTLESLDRLSVDAAITVGGDETALAAMRLAEVANGRIQFVHVPKTIDNDMALPDGIFTFGFQSARHVGVGIVKDLQVDAATTSRWYFIITMGRKSGHLALGIGKAAGVTLTIIPEEFRGATVPLRTVIDLLAGAIINEEATAGETEWRFLQKASWSESTSPIASFSPKPRSIQRAIGGFPR